MPELPELLSRIKAGQTRASQLKAELKAIIREKKEWLHKAREFKAQVDACIAAIRSHKEKRDQLTASVKTKKEQLAATRTSSTELKTKVSSLAAERDSLTGLKKTLRPDALKSEIQKIEFKIETEAVSFQEEQRLMKVIKEKKKALAEITGLQPIITEFETARGELSTTRDRIRELRLEVVSEAMRSQSFHEQMLAKVKELEVLKSLREEAHTQLNMLRERFEAKTQELEQELAALSELRTQADAARAEREKQRTEKEAKLAEERARMAAEKEKELKQKILQGKKLTTQDLLMLQMEG
ncbi:hypothetical protein HY640_03945 [Candidatus Woesearchaeota archaeon]|nr:hypothetical protein [Candidatus Woesearchaeota archaeon]